MKTFVFFSSLILCIASYAQEAYNPFESIGKTSTVVSLSDGRYKETYETDSIVQIGSVMFNTNTHKVVRFIDHTSTNTLPIEAELTTRWLSIDPLASKYPYLSPYNFVANSPLLFIDTDGREIWVYLSDGKGKVEYRSDGKMYNEDGTEYTGSDPFVNDVKNSLNSIKKVDFMNVIETLIKSKKDTKIVQTDGSSKANGYKVKYNPNLGLHVYTAQYNEDGSEDFSKTLYGTISPHLALLHELGHVYVEDQNINVFKELGISETEIMIRNYDKPEEKWVIEKIERPAAEKLGQGLRNNHVGFDVKTSSYESTRPVYNRDKINIVKDFRYRFYVKKEDAKTLINERNNIMGENTDPN